MPSDSPLYQALRRADEQNQIGYTRYLCEIYLKEHPSDVATLIRYACSLISLAQYSQARAALDKAQATVPKKHLHLVLAQRGHLLEAKGHFKAAEEMFMEAHKLMPIDATYLIYAGAVVFRIGEIDRAQDLAKQATECSKGCIEEAWFNLGGYLLSARRYQEAADCYRRALEIDPDYEIAKERLADVELIIGHKG